MNNKCKFLVILSLILLFASFQVKAERNKGAIVKKSPKGSASCVPPSQTTELSLNLVRALLKTNGTMWFMENAEYEVPKGSGKTSMFSGSLWIGGKDQGGQLYVAAMTFGQSGNDFWTGPLQIKEATIEQETCSKYDKFYRITRLEVERHINAKREGDNSFPIPQSILDWPATGSSTESHFLAPFNKLITGGDTELYEPDKGDYPYYDFANDLCPWTKENRERARAYPWVNPFGVEDELGSIENPAGLRLPPERVWTRQKHSWDNKMIYADHVLKGDETIFWFLNDKGGPHTETSSPRSIGLEIRVQAFAFATNDELNKMTFYSYEIVNRGSNTLYETFFSQWVDPDLGFADDDYVGCDVLRGLGYCYNGKEIDEGKPWAYGANPPAVGVDFFQGPYIDPDGTDNPKFHKGMGDILSNNVEQQEYCKKFVHYLIDVFGEEGPKNLATPDTTHTIIVERVDTVGIFDTLFLYWNNQYAINGVNFGDGIIDNERFGMRRFVYHNNDRSDIGNPDLYPDYYNYLRGIWRNGLKMTYGGTGYNPNQERVECDFMFPKGTDICNWGTKGKDPGVQFLHGGKYGNWSEEQPDGVNSQANAPGDRRFMQSAGPFTLRQGACNYITVGIPWARATSGGVAASVSLLMIADDKCQALFENCFKILDGPDAPHLTIREYDQKLVLLLTNPAGLSNNYKVNNEDYIELDNQIPEFRVDEKKIPINYVISLEGDTIFIGGDTIMYTIEIDTVWYDRYYRFEGYQIYQVIGPEVGANDLENPSLARLIRQCDIENYDSQGNSIGRLINWEFDEDIQVSMPKEKVNGTNSGIEHSFIITQDAFATGSKQLVNYKTYYFIAIAYAYNDYWPFLLEEQSNNGGLGGQKLPYLRGRKTPEGSSVTPISAVPHPPSVHGGALTLNCDYGSIPPITRIDGQGNCGIALELTQKTIDKIVNGGDLGDYRVSILEYEKDAGPLNIKVIDPLRVKPYDYTIVIRDSIIDRNSMDVSGNFIWELTIDPASASDDDLKAAGITDNGKSDGNPIRVFTSEKTIEKYNEQIIIPLGLSVGITNIDFNSEQKTIHDYWNVILEKYNYNWYRAKYIYYQPYKIDIESDVVFKNNGNEWITGLKNANYPTPSRWIRAGSFNLGVWDTKNSNTHEGGVHKFYNEWRLEDAFFQSYELVPDPTDKNGLNYDRAFKDYSGKFGTLCGGTWAPYVLTSPYDNCPQAKYMAYEPGPGITQPLPAFYAFQDLLLPRQQPGYNQTMTNLYSVDIVLTPDQNLWTRCVVLESCPNPKNSEGGALKNEPRKAKSVGKDGEPDGSTDGFGDYGDEGMGWFPGYAINLETGERLNIMFSENSDTTLKKFANLVKGGDMIFNPTSTYAIATKSVILGETFYFPVGTTISREDYDLLYQMLGESLLDYGIERIWGGMHYVYVCGSSGNTSPIYYLNQGVPTDFLKNAKRNFNLNDTVITKIQQWGPYGGYMDAEKQYPYYDCGSYDKGQWLVHKFNQYFDTPNSGNDMYVRRNIIMQLFNNVMYTHIPLQPEDPILQDQWLSCDVTYKIRVTRPYMRYASRWYESPDQRYYLKNFDDPALAELDYNGFPVYRMSTKELAPIYNDSRVYQSILDNINIVPNPYYGGSAYEGNPLQTQVKIINLPTDLKNNAPVTINIFTVNGILVRTLTKGDSETAYVNWDLKNYANIPIAGGVYIIHVNCPGIGERMLKFFCTMRPTDLSTF